jgi:hypothetical protein
MHLAQERSRLEEWFLGRNLWTPGQPDALGFAAHFEAQLKSESDQFGRVY